jgi:aspartate/methionine/tyrosine aminotransferase
MTLHLPDFALEVYLGAREFSVQHHLTASDAETMTIGELLALAGDRSGPALADLDLGYRTTWGGPELRAAVAATYGDLDPGDVLVFSGAQEAMFWAMQKLVGPGDHAIVSVPNYQSMESVTIATGADVSGLPLWAGSGSSLRWTLDLDRVRDLLRPQTKLIAVNFPNNPTGFVPDAATWAGLVELCEERGIRLFSDEVYRGLELDETRRLPQAVSLSPSAVSMNVMSKAYGMPGLRIGWLACQDRALLGTLERARHYTTICNSGPSEFLATLALRHAEAITARNRAIMRENLPGLVELFERSPDLIEWSAPDGGCVAFPRYLGADGVEEFCESLVRERSAVLLPASIYASQLADVPTDRFRIGLGRRDPAAGWAVLASHLAARQRARQTAPSASPG